MHVLGVDVDMIEEMLIHEVVVALGIVVRDTKVLVEVIRADLGEVDIALLVPIDKLVIGANGRIARSKAQNTVGLEDNLSRNDVGCLAAHVRIIASANDFDHERPLSKSNNKPSKA